MNLPVDNKEFTPITSLGCLSLLKVPITELISLEVSYIEFPYDLNALSMNDPGKT